MTERRKGTYLLFMTFPEPKRIVVGSLGTIDIDAKEYCYAGSAMNGLDGRIGRHLRKEKKIHWHIDHLSTLTDMKEAYVVSEHIRECTLAEMALGSGCIPMHKGFGCSDCGCATHLFLVDDNSKQNLLKMSNADPFCNSAELKERPSPPAKKDSAQ